MPSATLHPCRKAGSTAGSHTARRRRPSGRRNTFAISSSCGSAARMPVRTAPYSTGSTIRKLMSTDSEDPRTHTSARMMKLATGVALTSCSTGAIKTSAAGQISAATASAALHTTPSPKPSRMRPALNSTRCQKSACRSGQRRACTGDTRKTSCPMAMAAACHTASQNSTAPARRSSSLRSCMEIPSFLVVFCISVYHTPPQRPMTCASPAPGGLVFKRYFCSTWICLT